MKQAEGNNMRRVHITAKSEKQRGAVSLIVVIFTALLVTIITIGFVSLMVRNQQQATQSDLSQSAYDSALAGVEDAKRVLLLDKKCKENSGSVDLGTCARIATALASGACNTIKASFGGGVGDEMLIGQSEEDKQLRQSYTCAKILLNTPDYRRQGLESGKSHLIPLVGADTFDTIEIMWFTQEDAAAATGEDEGLGTVSLTWPPTGGTVLPQQDNWGSQTPPILRAQLMQTANTFNLSDFNDAGMVGDVSSNSTLFLYPSRDVTEANSFAQDMPALKILRQVKCDASAFRDGGYACSVSLALPKPKNGDASSRHAYLRLSAIYNMTRYRVVLKNAGQPVSFFNVQPEVDVTGKANDIFRRVKARVQLEADYPYPESAVDLDGNLCKDFTVTDNGNDYAGLNLDRCDPRD